MSGENSSPAKAGVPLQRVVKELTDYAPLALAESWDNVGLLVEPYTARDVTSIMLTNDLTKPVMDECLSKNIDMIISYHPPIFVGKKRITNKNWQDQIIACCLENRIAVYSPHTTWDSVRGGLSDWLASAFGQLDNYEEFESVSVLEPYCTFASPADHEYAVVVGGRPYDVNLLLESGGVNITSINIPNSRDPELKEFRGTFKKSDMFKFQQSIYTFNHLDVDHYKLTYEVYNRVPLPVLGTGVGRLLKLRKTMTIAEATDKMKTHLDVKHARIAYAVGANAGTVISSIALVPGSGAKPLSGVRADLYVTGEMLHHDVLAATHNGTSVLMSTHSDSERGFLKQFAQELRKRLGGSVAVTVSAADRDPIQTV